MPYKIVQHGSKFSVVAQNTGHVAGTHDSKKKAQAQMAALYANEPEPDADAVVTLRLANDILVLMTVVNALTADSSVDN